MSGGEEVFVTTERLVLRQMAERDAADLCRIVTDPSVGRMLYLFPPDWTVPDAAAFIPRCRHNGAPPFRLAVSDPSGRLLGTVGVAGGDMPEVFYFMDPGHSGRGYGTEAMTGFVRWLFATFGKVALKADVFDDNPASKRVLTRLGFVATGTGLGTSAARLEPAPITHYRLDATDFRVAAQ